MWAKVLTFTLICIVPISVIACAVCGVYYRKSRKHLMVLFPPILLGGTMLASIASRADWALLLVFLGGIWLMAGVPYIVAAYISLTIETRVKQSQPTTFR